MTEFRQVTGDFSVSPQISVEDVASAAEQGFALVINNRPDGETPGQPAGASIEAAAARAGLAYRHIAVVGRPLPGQVAAMREAIDSDGGRTLAFCRSGTRSITIWALAQFAGGYASAPELVRVARAAGYDLSGLLFL